MRLPKVKDLTVNFALVRRTTVQRMRTLRSIKSVCALHFPLLLVLVSVCILAACQRPKNIWDITEPSVTAGWITFTESANV